MEQIAEIMVFLDGIPEAKKLMADMMGTTPDHVIVYGNASLNIMYDQISRAYTHGILGNNLHGASLIRLSSYVQFLDMTDILQSQKDLELR